MGRGGGSRPRGRGAGRAFGEPFGARGEPRPTGLERARPGANAHDRARGGARAVARRAAAVGSEPELRPRDAPLRPQTASTTRGGSSTSCTSAPWPWETGWRFTYLAWLAEVELRAGNWERHATHAQGTRELAHASSTIGEAWGAASSAVVEAHLGNEDDALRAGEHASRSRARRRIPSVSSAASPPSGFCGSLSGR